MKPLRNRRARPGIGNYVLLPGTVLLALFVVLADLVGATKVRDKFPSLNGFGLEGNLPELIDGKVVLVDFWASWCLPCKQSFPALNEINKGYATRGLVIVGVNVDEQRGAMERFLKSTPAAFAIVRDAKQKLVAAVDAEAMPATVILDAAGKVRFIHRGYHGESTRLEYEREIQLLLKEMGE